MKKIVIHSVSIVISLFWLINEHHTYNPVYLKGPDFLQFYLILLTSFYASVLILKIFKESISKATFFFMIFILILGIIKLIRGLMLGKPIGYLMMILIAETIVILFITAINFKHKIK